MSDIRMALRSLLRRPGFTALAVLVFGVGAGATAAILAVLYGVLLKPLPYREPDRLVAVWPGRFQSNADLLYLREHGSMFSGLAAGAPGWTMSLTGWGDPAKVTVARVSGNLFELFGVRPQLGRVFRESDARSGADRVAILTHAFWVKQFAGDPGIIGRAVRLEAEPFEVVGVMRPDFDVFDIEGHPVPEGGSRPTAGLRIATPDYFRTIGQPVSAGREFAFADAARGDAVIVNETLAKAQYGGAPAALNRRLRIRGAGIQSPWMTVVGVVGDVRHSSLTEPVRPEIYTSISNTSIPAMMVAVRAGGDPLSLVPAVREAIWSIDRNTPISDVQTMTAKIGASLARPRLLVILLGSFATMGVLLALVGVYGVVAYSVAQRRREIGIMVALGAGRSRVMRLVLGDGLRYAAAGLAVGVPAALAGSRLLETLLYGVDASDARTHVSLAGLMLGVVLAASYVPARRASRVDPIDALKYE